ncbi:MAG: DUF2169 domain-containing protein [Deltaproteobacteria bacterium]|nr:DUF2169 domain-containing protein [Deltaproteobacteria bacterium]
MPDFEQHGWQGFWIPGRRCTGQHGVAIIVKRRFEVDMMDATCRPAVTPPVALMAEDFDDGEPPMVSVKRPGEIAIEKPNVDIIVSGTAHAPGGKPVPQFDVELKIPRVVTRRLRIFGNRKLIWYPPLKWLTKEDMLKGETWVWPDPDFSEPEPIDKLPLRYEHAYGGWAKIELTDDDKEMAEEAQEKGKVVEEKRKKKKEIEEKLKKEEADEKKKEADKKKPKPKGITDEKAAKIAEKAFLIDEGVDLKLDDEKRKKLAAEDAKDDGMKIVSAYRLGQHMAERPEDEEGAGDKEGDEADEGGGGDGKGKKEDKKEKKEASEMDKFFTEEKTSALDLNKLKEMDEFKELLDERAVTEARKLKDEEGTLRDRATEFGDIKLTDDGWDAAYVKPRAEKKKRKLEDTEKPQMPYPANMVGKGFVISHLEEAIEGVPLPNIEDPDELISNENFVVDLTQFDLKKLRTPAGWAPYPMAWYPRAQHWGVYFWDLDKAKLGLDKAKEEFDPDDPDDKVALEQLGKFEFPIMNALAFQEAHPKLQVKEIRGDEEVYIQNMTPAGTLFFRLPGVHPTVTVDMSKGPVPLRMRLDTLLIDIDDPEKPAVEMLWRGWVPLKSFQDLEVTPLKKVTIIETDQEGWNKLQAKQAKGETGLSDDGLTKTIKAVTDEDEDLMGEAAELKYRDQFKKTKDGFGAKVDDDTDALVFDQDQDRQLYKDDWDESIKKDKDAFVEAEKKKADELQKLKDKALKAKAREQADEELGIIRDPDTGEIIAVEPPDKGGGKKKGK